MPFVEEILPQNPNVSVSVIIDGEEVSAEYDDDGAAVVSVDAGDKTILTVVVDDEVVLDQARSDGKGEELAKAWSERFTEGSHSVKVTLGYKLTVKTCYVNSEGINGNHDPSLPLDCSDPTYYTLVVPEGEVDEPIALLPLPSADGKYPLRLLDYEKVVVPGFDHTCIGVRYVTSYEPGSDDPDEWIRQSTDTGVAARYVTLKKMIGDDAEIELWYNYSKIATFVQVQFEKPDGSFVLEDYNDGSPAHLSAYHSQDTLVNETDRVTFDPRTHIFGDDVKYPEGTSAEDYALYGVILGTDHNGYQWQWVNFWQWPDASNTIGAGNFNKETGLILDPATGAVDGTLINAIDARNITMIYYFHLLRSVRYDANGGEGAMDAHQAFNGESVILAGNTFSRTGYTFTGWNTSADGSGTAYQPEDVLTMGAVEGVTLYAQWKPSTYTVTYTDGLNGAAFETVEFTVSHGDRMPAFEGIPVVNGHRFLGWDKEIAEIVTENVTYTAKWSELYTVVYTDGVNGSVFADQSYNVEAGSRTPGFAGTPTRGGYTFLGWDQEIADTVTGDVTYTAQWRYNGGGSGGSGGGGGGGSTPPAPSNPSAPVVETEIPEEDVPLAEIPEEKVPLAEIPEEPEVTEILDEEVPLANVPETGDAGAGWLMAMLTGALGLFWMGLTAKSKKREEGEEV